MAERTPQRALWEEFAPDSPEQLLGLLAAEAWSRTGAPAYDAQLAEAELAHVRAGGSWHSYIRLETLYRNNAEAYAEQAVWFGFILGVVARDRQEIAADPQRLFADAMRVAGLVPVSDEVKTECLARTDRAIARRQRLIHHRQHRRKDH